MIRRLHINFPVGLLQYESGYVGAFTRAEADGAWKNGTRVVKIKREQGDHHDIGSKATILGSIRTPNESIIMYFIEWDAMPKSAVACAETKLGKLER